VASMTFLQHFAGPYVEGGDLSRAMAAAFAAVWTTTITADFRLLRSVPLSRYLIAATLTAGVGSAILAPALVEGLGYGFGLGFWPQTLHIRTLIATICLVALAKNGVLAVGRGWLFLLPALAMPVMSSVQAALDHFTTVAPVPMAVSAVLVLAL